MAKVLSAMAKTTYRRWTSWPILSQKSHEAGLGSELNLLNSSETYMELVVSGLCGWWSTKSLF